MLVVPDTPAKRREYEEEVVRTRYVSNADLKETMDLLRMVLDARRISPTTGINALTIKDTPDRITAAARLLSAIDKARPEVIIDVELLEVDRTRLKEYGLQLASPTTEPPIGIDGTVSIAGDVPAISLQALRNLTQADVLLANLPRLCLSAESDANTRALATSFARRACRRRPLGERVPVPVTTFSIVPPGHPAADHVVQLRKHRCEHRHHAADASRRRCHVDVEGRRAEHLGRGIRRLPTFANRGSTP